MGKLNDYTLFYCAEDGKMHKGTCREEKEVLIDIQIGEAVEMDGFRGNGLELTFTGFVFETTADIALVVPENTTLVLESGTSILRVFAQGPEANVATLYVKGNLTITGGEGTLINDATNTSAETTLWSRCICARYGDLTISGGRVEAYCGSCSVRSGAVYAGGRLYGGDNQHGAITITGGHVIASAVPHTIRATNTELTLGPNSVVVNSNEFSGSAEEWHGDYLAQADPSRNVEIYFQ